MKQALGAQNGFEQNQKNIRSRTIGIFLYQYGCSLRNYQPVVSGFEPISHDAIQKGYPKTAALFSMEKTYGEIIAADETKINVNKRVYMVYAVVHGQQWFSCMLYLYAQCFFLIVSVPVVT